MSPHLRSRSQERSVRSESTTFEKQEENGCTMVTGHNDSFRLGEPQERRSSMGRSHAILRRTVSDPFDANEDNDDEVKSGVSTAPPSPVPSSSSISLPTLPRFPCAEQQDENCWSQPSIDIFRVRGPTYLSTRVKVPSKPFLLRARGCDLLLTTAQSHGDIVERSSSLLGGTLRQEASVVVNFRFPWGMLLLYYGVPEIYEPFLDDKSTPIPAHFTPAEEVFCKWLKGDEDYKNERFKLIPYVAEGPWVVRNMVLGTPALIGKKLPVSYHTEPSSKTQQRINRPFLSIEMDIGSSSATAKRIVGVCRRYMNALTVDIGFVIQGNTAKELPEQMMGSTRIHRVDPLKAPTLD